MTIPKPATGVGGRGEADEVPSQSTRNLTFSGTMIKLLMGWIVVIAVASFVTIPWLAASNGGDLTKSQIWFYHAFMLPAALLFLIICTRVFRVHSWVEYLVSHSALVAIWEGAGFMILAYGTLHHVSSLVSFGYWVILPATIELFAVTVLYVIDLAWCTIACHLIPARRPALPPRKAEITWAFFLTGVSVLSWVIFGLAVAANQVGLSWQFWAGWQHESNADLMGNILTAHSHGLVPSFMAAIVLVAAEAFGYSKMVGVRSQVARLGVGVMLGGIALYSSVYAVSAVGTFVIPAWFPYGKGGANGLAMDDTFTGLMGVGALILAGAMIPEVRGIFVRAAGGFGRVLRRLNPVRVAVYLSYVTAAVALFFYGYYIEFNETSFGAGASGPHMMGDQVFMRAHILFAFGSLPIIAVFLLASEIAVRGSSAGITIRKVMGSVVALGMVITLVGMGIWVFTVPGHSSTWGSVNVGEVLYVIGQSLILIGALVSLFAPSISRPDEAEQLEVTKGTPADASALAG